MPRRYNLGQRATSKEETRERIVEAALEILRDRGLSTVSNLAIARAADVAPATVRNHFPEEGDLPRAVFDALVTQLRVPTPDLFDGVDDVQARVELLATELAHLYERSEPWWRAYEREPELIRVWAGGIDQYYAGVDGLMRAALGELSTDPHALAVVASVIGPPTFFALRARGLSSAEAVRVSVDLAGPWLEARRSRASGDGPRRERGTPAGKPRSRPDRYHRGSRR
jgi:AcrR family transcriptional regulator